jgi:hypothetical protein
MEIDSVSLDIHSKYKGIQWNINHTIVYEINSFKLSTKCSLIGYTEDNVVICYVKPWMNENEMKLRSLLDSFIVFNVSNENEKNKLKYFGKSIVCKFISLSGLVTIEWNNLGEVVRGVLRESLVNYYMFQSKTIYPFYKYCIENEKDVMNEYRKFGDKNAGYIEKFLKEYDGEMNEDMFMNNLLKKFINISYNG